MAVGRVLIRLGLVLFRLGEPGSEEAIAEALDVLEAQPAGPELVSAYSYDSGGHALRDHRPEAIAAAERALALAAELGLPEPAFALHWRGLVRCWQGDAGGIEDMRRALTLALEQGLGRETGVIYANLGAAVWPYQGPRAVLEVYEAGVTFCERRGMTEMTLHFRASGLLRLAELGETEKALAELGSMADAVQATGDKAFTSYRGWQLSLLAECGTPELAPDPDELLDAARRIGEPDRIAYALAHAARLLLAREETNRARALMHELDALIATHDDLLDGAALPPLVRVALALGEVRVAERLTTLVKPLAPLDQHALASAHAQLAEAGGDHAEGARLYRQAVDGWREFGSVPESAYALLGLGRCLAVLGDAEADAPLREARDLFAGAGYAPALAETNGLLQRRQLAAS